jgi:hypothetical protein
MLLFLQIIFMKKLGQKKISEKTYQIISESDLGDFLTVDFKKLLGKKTRKYIVKNNFIKK